MDLSSLPACRLFFTNIIFAHAPVSLWFEWVIFLFIFFFDKFAEYSQLLALSELFNCFSINCWEAFFRFNNVFRF